jgi:hypothetical protein
MPASSQVFDRLKVSFDDEHSVANAGLVVPATFAVRLGLEELVDDGVDLGPGPGRPTADGRRPRS